MPAAVALNTTLDEIAQVTSRWITPTQRLRRNLLYLTRSRTGYTFMQDCGIRMDRQMITAWLAEERIPSPEQQRRLEDAFRLLRRRNMAPSMTRRLNARGGTRVEIYPVDQSDVDDKHRRTARWRRKNIYRWDPIVAAWSRSDLRELTHRWHDVITDLDSDWRMYEHVTHLGFWA
ncbi:transcriptional regulator [Streptomyces longwoodensis]|uniref:transcriptional regulator n=1 Tax=Streptomyces longwoodensis TaxID=68231 RepID=UPI002E8171BB|nr:transcriptional regulator [Streptomyces longwoodensis]WUC55727.1 transcriptional regulator [Streptomyces longwoodensis]WUC62154.1 transcriptional regulator [Streptomyces longwoodensis]